VPTGITLNFEPKHPATGHPLDVEAAVVEHDHFNRWFLDPIVGLPYPEHGARAWGWDLGEIRSGDPELIAEPIDLLGVNYYRREIVRSPLLDPLGPAPPVERTSMGWEVYPAGLAEALAFVRSRTGDLPLYVTENGAAFEDGPDPERDPARVDYLRRHLAVALEAIGDGVPLRGYFVWSLLDNFEWAEGYGPRFGIVHVDYATQGRRIRDSGRFLAWAARSGALPDQDDPS
jgi:beta-glucosidase